MILLPLLAAAAVAATDQPVCEKLREDWDSAQQAYVEVMTRGVEAMHHNNEVRHTDPQFWDRQSANESRKMDRAREETNDRGTQLLQLMIAHKCENLPTEPITG